MPPKKGNPRGFFLKPPPPPVPGGNPPPPFGGVFGVVAQGLPIKTTPPFQRSWGKKTKGCVGENPAAKEGPPSVGPVPPKIAGGGPGPSVPQLGQKDPPPKSTWGPELCVGRVDAQPFAPPGFPGGKPPVRNPGESGFPLPRPVAVDNRFILACVFPLVFSLSVWGMLRCG